ncbi:MAG: hypothetical protein ACD_75C00390G0002 [uncultured bacterium]|nr:MAG: hypothetical protein ACD_75C00390G0002 [uncultured bacterium]
MTETKELVPTKKRFGFRLPVLPKLPFLPTLAVATMLATFVFVWFFAG